MVDIICLKRERNKNMLEERTLVRRVLKTLTNPVYYLIFCILTFFINKLIYRQSIHDAAGI